MRRRGAIFLICALLLIASSTGVAQAQASAQPVNFSILGYTTDLGTYRLEKCRFVFEGLTAIGRAEGDLAGSFAYKERGWINLCLRYGINDGQMLVTTERGMAIIGFRGATDMTSVWGKWELKGGTGDYAAMNGEGTYSGDAAWARFTVSFSGLLYPG